jgi:uncharacterized membrane protein YphA (DoxX/SURF4 family)
MNRACPHLRPHTVFDPPPCILHDSERRFPLNDKKYQIGLLAVVMLVALRLTIGWHFFYEGVWKIANADKFSASDFLIMSKGPFVPLFHAMVPDLDGRVRLAPGPVEDQKRAKEGWVTSPVFLAAWTETRDKFAARNNLSDEQKKALDDKFGQYETSLEEFMTDNAEDLKAHYDALDRFIARKYSGVNEAEHEKVRIWEEQVKLRGEAKAWLSDLDAMGEEMCSAFYQVLDDDQQSRAKVPYVMTAPEKLPVPLPFFKSRAHFLDVTVTYALTAIGLCLLLGFCNRLACLGGGAFLISVLMTQPPWPTLIPHAPAVVGHALIVDKNFVEMVAIFMLATLPVGRWAGLDHFLYHWIGRPLEAKIPFLKKLNV